MKKNKQNEADIKLLLIEDDEDAAEAMALTLRKFGVPVKTVPSGELGIEEWKAGDYDVVVSDIRMPGMDGVGVLRAIRGEDPDFPVLLMTAYEQIETAIEALRLGAQDYILKPVTHMEAFLLSVRKAVDHHRLLVEHRAVLARLKALTSELLQIEEKERRQLAVNLHDSVGQSLVITKMKIEKIASISPEGEVRNLAHQGSDLLGEILHQTRFLIFNLSPPILYDLGLTAALDSLVVQIRKVNGLAIHYTPANLAPLLSQEMNVVLFRSIRELLCNAMKHSQASRFSLTLSRDDEHVQIVVEDDGVGFDVAGVTAYDSNHFGYGLFSVREQLSNIQGALEITSRKGGGTRAVIKVDVSEKMKELGGL